MQRVALINWTNKNQDYDLAKIFSSIATSWVVEWLEVQSGKVTPGHAFVDVVRDGITFPILFTNTQDIIINTTWDKKVFVEITQANIDDGSGNSSDGTWIGEIKASVSYPTSNYVKLASISSWVITDEREFIKLKDEKLNNFNWPNQLMQLGGDGKVPPETLPWSADITWVIKQWSWITAPSWYFICDWQAISRETYSDLFAIIWTIYGIWDWSTTFNIPDLQGKIPVWKNWWTFSTLWDTGWAETHTLTEAQMPAHNHRTAMTWWGWLWATRSIWSDWSHFWNSYPSDTSTKGSGAAHNNLQPYLVINHIIKF